MIRKGGMYCILEYEITGISTQGFVLVHHFELHIASVSLDKGTTCSRTRFEFCYLSLQLLYFHTQRNVDTLGYAFSELVRYAKYPDLSAGESNDQQIRSIPSTYANRWKCTSTSSVLNQSKSTDLPN